MSYWVLKTKSRDGAVIDAYPANGPTGWKYDEGKSLLSEFARSAFVSFSANFPDLRKLHDFQPNILSALIVSRRARDAIEGLKLDNAEFLPVSVKDHRGAVVADDYAFLNLLGAEEAIDMGRSSVVMDSLEKDQIQRIKKLVLDPRGIRPEARMFRCARERRLVLVRDDVKEAFEKVGLTGYRLFAADGWNGFDF